MTLQFGSSASLADTFSNRPASDPTKVGRYFLATDTGALYRDNGSSWDQCASSAADVASAIAAALEIVANEQTDDYTLALSDGAGNVEVQMNKASAVNLNIPLHATVAFDTGTVIGWQQTGAGVITFTKADGSITINSLNSLLSSAGQFALGALKYEGADVWSLIGALA